MTKLHTQQGEEVTVDVLLPMLCNPSMDGTFSDKQRILAEVALDYFQEAYWDEAVGEATLTQDDVSSIEVYSLDDLIGSFADEAKDNGFSSEQLDNPTDNDKKELWEFFDNLLDSRSPWHDPERMVIITDI